MAPPSQDLGSAGVPLPLGSDVGAESTSSSSLPLAPPTLSRSSSAMSVKSSSSSSAEYHIGGNDGPHRRSPSIPAPATFAAASSGPTLVHPLPQVGTISNRPAALQLETSNLWFTQDDQQSRGRSTEIDVSPNRSATSSPVSRFHSPITAKAPDHLHPSLQAQSALSSGHGAHAHHASSNLRHSHVPSQSSPPHQTSAFASSGGAPPRPGLVSNHSHLQPDESLPWQQRLRFACTSPDTGRWQMPAVLAPYMPFMAWAGTSLGFVVVFTFWRQELFTGLDTMSVSLAEMGLLGKSIMGLLIFLTCFPPLPLYSTLIILSGYAFGAWNGFVISYIAALSGALIVFLLSRSLFRGAMIRMLSKSPSLARVIHAIECRPSLLFLIRLAPYPYNVMNTLLASSRTLSLKVYTGVTGVSLFKLIIHTTIGSTIHSWGDHYAPSDPTSTGRPLGGHAGSGAAPITLTQDQIDAAARGQLIQKTWTVIGIGLCIGLFIYLTIVARNAVNETNSPSGGYSALPTTDSREMAQRGRSMSRSSDSFPFAPAATNDTAGDVAAGSLSGADGLVQLPRAEPWRHSNGRPLSVGGVEGFAGLGGVPRAQ